MIPLLNFPLYTIDVKSTLSRKFRFFDRKNYNIQKKKNAFSYYAIVNATAFAFRFSSCIVPCRYKMCCHLTFSRKHLFLEVLLMDEFLS